MTTTKTRRTVRVTIDIEIDPVRYSEHYASWGMDDSEAYAAGLAFEATQQTLSRTGDWAVIIRQSSERVDR